MKKPAPRKTTPADPLLSRLEERLSSGGGGGRSRLSVWMETHQGAFAALQARYRGRWSLYAEEFARAGLLTVPEVFWSERPEDAEARAVARRRAEKVAKTTWERVRERPAKRAAAAAAARKPRAKEAAVGPVAAVFAVAPDDDGARAGMRGLLTDGEAGADTPAERRPRFGPARLKGWTPGKDGSGG